MCVSFPWWAVTPKDLFSPSLCSWCLCVLILTWPFHPRLDKTTSSAGAVSTSWAEVRLAVTSCTSYLSSSVGLMAVCSIFFLPQMQPDLSILSWAQKKTKMLLVNTCSDYASVLWSKIHPHCSVTAVKVISASWRQAVIFWRAGTKHLRKGWRLILIYWKIRWRVAQKRKICDAQRAIEPRMCRQHGVCCFFFCSTIANDF